MNILDLILAIPIVWLAIRGFIKGLIVSLVTLAALILGIWAGIRFSAEAGQFLGTFISVDASYLPLIAFTAIIVVVMIVAFIFGKLIEKVVDLMALGLVNKLLGALFGILKAVVLLSFILYLITWFDQKEKLITPAMKENSMLYKPGSSVAAWGMEKVGMAGGSR
jgi:membrane protein required for colicin V production